MPRATRRRPRASRITVQWTAPRRRIAWPAPADHHLRHGPRRVAVERVDAGARHVRLHAGGGHASFPRARHRRLSASPSRRAIRRTTRTRRRGTTINAAQAAPVDQLGDSVADHLRNGARRDAVERVDGVPGTLHAPPAAGTVLNAGAAQTLSVTFTPDRRRRTMRATATARMHRC